MPTALSDVKARIAAVMATVAGIGNVYDRLRNLSVEADQAQLLSGGRVNVWMIHREGSVLTDQVVNQNFVEQRDAIVIEGFYAVKDADDSESAFEVLVDAILQALNADRRPPSHLNGTSATAGPPSLRLHDQRLYGVSQVLCHHAEIVMQVTPRYLQ